ncbi:MAG: glutamine--tRNA ligase, partial [Gammaproteobacteria bacterium]|nr:glutamine--tRNA ligase [Gammaproteobacteria bacterium]
DEKDYKEYINADSLRTLTQCYVEASLSAATPGETFQFEREGYYCLDEKHVSGNMPVFNRTVTLRDTWGKKK